MILWAREFEIADVVAESHCCETETVNRLPDTVIIYTEPGVDKLRRGTRM